MDTGHAAWLLASCSLVLLMTPALALFYGGMTRAKSVLNMMMMSFGAMAAVVPIYLLWGYAMSYGSNHGAASIGGLFANPFEHFGLAGIVPEVGSSGAGELIGVAFQMTFAIITVALISGSIAERVKFSTWLVFVAVWVTVCYFPLAHMVWGGGLLSADGFAGSLFDGVAPIDYAGGSVVHINAGIAGLVLAIVIGQRRGFGKEPIRPHNLPLTMLGAGLLWFGWFGFNVGSFVSYDDLDFATSWVDETGLVWVNTTAAAAAAILGWLLLEKLRYGKSTSLGAASGVVAGLVAITPAAGALSPLGSLALGFIAGIACAFAVGLKFSLGFDDSLDVVGVHLVGGLVGTLGVGLFATAGGLLYGDGIKLLIVQCVVAGITMAWTGLFTLIIAVTLKRVLGWRVDAESEERSVDFAEHGESAYDLATTSGSTY